MSTVRITLYSRPGCHLCEQMREVAIYTVDPASVTFRDVTQAASFDTLVKSLEIDLLAAGSYDPFAGFVPEKLEGMAVLSDGTTLVVNDNDGVEDNSGETVVVRLPQLLQ